METNNRTRDKQGFKSNRDNQSKGGYAKPKRQYQGKDSRFKSNQDKPIHNSRRNEQSSAKEQKKKEQQPDKLEIINRIEKEKKVMKKKTQASQKNKQANARPPVRVKRMNNIDWTKEYENDSYDDDDAHFMY